MDQSDRVLCREAERLLRVDGREDDHRLDAGLVENDAYQKPRKVPIARCLARRLREPRKGCPSHVLARDGWHRAGAFPKNEKGRQARRGEGRGGDQHRDGYELLCLLAVALSPGDVSQAKPEGQQSSQVAEAPAPARHTSQRFAPRELGKERGDEVLAGAEAEVGDHEQRHRERQGPGPGDCEQGGGDHAAGRGESEQALFCRAQVGVGPEDGRGQQNASVGNRKRSRPGESRPRRVACDHGDEIGVEHGCDHHCGVTRVGEVVHRPGKHFSRADVPCESDAVGCHGTRFFFRHDTARCYNRRSRVGRIRRRSAAPHPRCNPG